MKISFVGHSHISCIFRAHRELRNDIGHVINFAQLRKARLFKDGRVPPGLDTYNACDHNKVRQFVRETTEGSSLTVLCPGGTEYIPFSLVNKGSRSEEQIFEQITVVMKRMYLPWLKALAEYVASLAAVIVPPPPVQSEPLILSRPGRFAEEFAAHGIMPAHTRLNCWLHQKKLCMEMADACGLDFIELPDEVLCETGFLRDDLYGDNPSHANDRYGELMLRHIINVAAVRAFEGKKVADDVLSSTRPERGSKDCATGRHPYVGLPDYAYWKQAVAQVPIGKFDPVLNVPFKVSRSDKVATAGSCFAQHISKRIRSSGFQFFVAEACESGKEEGADNRGFYDFSARYGNIYTARQLIQLFDRAFGYFRPVDVYWRFGEDRFCDPFRPRIEPDGFSAIQSLLDDRDRHFTAVRDMFSRLDVFVFTLGLTECWVSRLDGAAYPIAPGVAGGEHDPSKYEFVNFGVDEVVPDLRLFIHKLRLVNPRAKVILTVSPVPLAATYEPRNVLVSTTYSKSVLRVAAEVTAQNHHDVYYFPSYEIITGNYNRGRYYGADLRAITQEGVDHVMSVFMKHLTEGGDAQSPSMTASQETQEGDEAVAELMALAAAECDEELLEKDYLQQ